MRRAIIPALLLVLVSVVLGATVFREQVANAAATLLVREQNTDANGNIRVHEQGTANVRQATPPNAFSYVQSGSNESLNCPGLPPGTHWYISSFSVAQVGGTEGHGARIFLVAGPSEVQGPVITVGISDTTQLTFSQPLVLTQTEDSMCLADFTSANADIRITVVGYHD